MKNAVRRGWAVAPQFGRAKRNPPVDFQFPVCAVGKKTSGSSTDPFQQLALFEILIDFFQMVSILIPFIMAYPSSSFAFVYLPALRVFGLYFEDLLPASANLAIFYVLVIAMSALTGIAALICRDVDTALSIPGLPALRPLKTATNQVSILFGIMSFLYLPTARYALEVVYESHHFFNGAPLASIVVGGVTSFAALVLYLIAFPHIIQNAVERHRPMAIPVDKSIEASELIAMEEQKAAIEYSHRVIEDDYPLKFLYAPYSAWCAQSKPYMLRVKLLGVILGNVCVWSGAMPALSYLTGVGLVMVVGYWTSAEFRRSRYSDPSLDTLHMRLRVCALAITAIVLLDSGGQSIEFLFGVILICVELYCAVQMVANALLRVRPLIRRHFRRRLTCTLTKSMAPVGDYAVFDADFNPESHRMLRIWNEFWDLYLFDDESRRREQQRGRMRVPDISRALYSNSIFHRDITEPARPLPVPSLEVRALENMVVADDLSNFQTLIDITTDKDMHDNLLLVMRHLHGPNVYWAMDGGKSKTMFGTLHIRTTPLQVELHYEDCDDVVVFDIGKGKSIGERPKLRDLLQANHRDVIVERRRIRSMLKAMDGFPCRTLFRRAISVAVGLRRDHEDVQFTFRSGIIRLLPNNKNTSLLSSFQCFIEYRDGTGTDRSGRSHKFPTYLASIHDLGISWQFNVNSALLAFFQDNWVPQHSLLSAIMLEQQSRINDLRTIWINYQFQRKHSILSPEFWAFVYNNGSLSKANLLAIIAAEIDDTSSHWNTPAEAQRLKDIADIDMLYERLAYFDCDVGVSYWFCFWHDLWVANFDAEQFRSGPMLDCYQSSAIAYRPVPETELLRDLTAARLVADDASPNGTSLTLIDILCGVETSNRLQIPPAMITRLYKRMSDLEKSSVEIDPDHEDDAAGGGVGHAARVDPDDDPVAVDVNQAARRVKTKQPAGKGISVRAKLLLDDQILTAFSSCRSFFDPLIKEGSRFDNFCASEREQLCTAFTLEPFVNGPNVVLTVNDQHKESKAALRSIVVVPAQTVHEQDAAKSA